MKKKELQAIAQAAAKNIKTEEDLNEFRAMLSKITVEAALNADLDDHLGFDKHEQSDSDNNRNGVTHKTLQTEDGQFELATPRDRMASCWWVCRKGDHRIEYLCCKSACKNDPLTGVIGVQN